MNCNISITIISKYGYRFQKFFNLFNINIESDIMSHTLKSNVDIAKKLLTTYGKKSLSQFIVTVRL